MSTFSELIANIDAMIEGHAAAILEHNEQIVQLKSARELLTKSTSAESKPANRRARRSKSNDDEVKMVTDKQLYWLDRKGYDGDKPADELTRDEASEILDGLFNGDADEAPEEKPATKRTSRTSRRAKRTNVKSAERKSNGNGNKSTAELDEQAEKQTRKDSILLLLSEGLKPKDIADELGINPSYVYLVRREAAKSTR